MVRRFIWYVSWFFNLKVIACFPAQNGCTSFGNPEQVFCPVLQSVIHRRSQLITYELAENLLSDSFDFLQRMSYLVEELQFSFQRIDIIEPTQQQIRISIIEQLLSGKCERLSIDWMYYTSQDAEALAQVRKNGASALFFPSSFLTCQGWNRESKKAWSCCRKKLPKSSKLTCKINFKYVHHSGRKVNLTLWSDDVPMQAIIGEYEVIIDGDYLTIDHLDKTDVWNSSGVVTSFWNSFLISLCSKLLFEMINE